MQKVRHKTDCFNNKFQDLFNVLLFNMQGLRFNYSLTVLFYYCTFKLFQVIWWSIFFLSKFHVFRFTSFFYNINNLILGIFTLNIKYFLVTFSSLLIFFYLFHVRSPLLTKFHLIYFPLANEMFQFAKFFNKFSFLYRYLYFNYNWIIYIVFVLINVFF